MTTREQWKYVGVHEEGPLRRFYVWIRTVDGGKIGYKVDVKRFWSNR